MQGRDREQRDQKFAHLRAISKRERHPFHLLRSIEEDALYVQSFCTRYPSIPVLPNVRAGAWYVPPPWRHGVALFKSTDGHYRGWKFSLRRLNMNVAHLAAEHGAVIVVDATRKGKRFPDAFNVTIPLWCAVLNGAIDRVRSGTDAGENGVGERRSLPLPPVHLPHWVLPTEQDQITATLPDWIDKLMSLKLSDLPQLAKSLRKPLRPVWFCKDDSDAFVLDIDVLDYIPIICLSASSPNTPVRGDYKYCPGAGDDEESWCRGLTPQLFWTQHTQLMDINNADKFLTALDAIIHDHRVQVEEGGPVVDAKEYTSHYSMITGTTVAIGDFESGDIRYTPEHFDAVLNVGGREHPFYCGDAHVDGVAYGYLPIADGKKDRHSLEDSLQSAIEFLCPLIYQGKRVLIHSENGTSRAVAVGMVMLAICYLYQGDQEGAGQAVCSDDKPCSRTDHDSPHVIPLQLKSPDQRDDDVAPSKLLWRQILGVITRVWPRTQVSRLFLAQINRFFHSQGMYIEGPRERNRIRDPGG